MKTLMLSILLEASLERPNKKRWIGNELEWVIYEREVMLKAVNTERARLKRKPITIINIKRVEQQAFGYSDYSSKFALYCAELVNE